MGWMRAIGQAYSKGAPNKTKIKKKQRAKVACVKERKSKGVEVGGRRYGRGKVGMR